MRARIDAGTDVAMIGLWDAQRSSEPLTPAESRHFADALEKDSAQGHLFLVHTGGDGGGPVDLYIEEAIPADVMARLEPGTNESLLLLPSGALTVGGAEDYRSAKPRITGSNSVVQVPAGEYSVRCFAAKDEEQADRSEAALRILVGREDLEYYDRVNRSGCVAGAALLLLFPILLFPLGWKLALPVTIAAVLAFFPIFRWFLRRNSRYQRLDKVIPGFRLGNADPTFVFELRRRG